MTGDEYIHVPVNILRTNDFGILVEMTQTDKTQDMKLLVIARYDI